jgi:hypothetical protein
MNENDRPTKQRHALKMWLRFTFFVWSDSVCVTIPEFHQVNFCPNTHVLPN